MPDIIIQRNVTISRAVQAEAIYEKIQDGQFEMAVCDQIELWPITWFVQGGASFYASSFAGAMDIGFYFDIIDNPADPHTTDPEEYCWNISINGPKAKIRRLWGTGSANGTAFAPVLLTSVPYNDASGDDPAMSGTVTGSITLQGQFNVHLIYGEGYGQEPEIYYAYQHYDNYGPAEGGMSIYYEPISNLSVCWTFCGGESIYATVDALSVEAKAALRTGLGAAGGTISIVDGNMRNTDIRKVGSISAEGVPGALTDLEQTLLDDSGNGEVMARGTLTASTLTLYGARLKQANANTLGMNLWLGGYSPWYNGHCEHLDGTPVAGALFSSWDIYDNTQLAGSTGSDGNVSLRPSWHYAGCLDFGFINADGYLPQAHREGGDVSTRYISSRGGTIENCREIGEPRFSMGGYVDTAREDDPVPGFGKDWAGFGDGRVYFDGPENTRCTGAVYYSTPKTVQACQFKDVTGWTVTPAGAATFSLDAEGYVKVTTTGACSVKRNLSNVSLKSYRYCDLYYDSSDGGDLGVKLNAGQREYKVNGSRKYLDLIAPVNINGVDTTVAGWQMTDPSWGYGVWSVSDIEITGLRPGHTYTLKGLVKRRTTLTIRIDDGPFVGDTMGHARLGDPPSLWTVTAPGTGQDGHIRGRKGVVYHDNLPIAEIIDMEHYMVPAEPRAFWMHEPLKFNDELNRTIHPVDSPVTFGIHNAGGREWMTGDREVAFLERGIYTTEGDTLLLPWKVTGTSLKVPFGFDLLGLAFTKKFRGRVVAKIFQQDGTPAAGGYVTAILRKKAGGTIVGNWTEGPIGPDGSLIMLARPQATSIARICTGIAGNVWTTNIDPSESLVGHTIGFGTYPRGKPILAEIAAQNGNQITISWAPEAAPNGAPQASPEAPLTFYVVMPYALDIEVTTTTGSKTTATVELRNRLWYPVTIKADGPVINKPGLIYEPAVNGQLGYTPASSDQLECVP